MFFVSTKKSIPKKSSQDSAVTELRMGQSAVQFPAEDRVSSLPETARPAPWQNQPFIQFLPGFLHSG